MLLLANLSQAKRCALIDQSIGKPTAVESATAEPSLFPRAKPFSSSTSSIVPKHPLAPHFLVVLGVCTGSQAQQRDSSTLTPRR